MSKVKVCLHNHTFRSRNSINTLEDFKKAFDESRVDKIAITDHDYVNEAKILQNYFGEERIIIGEEISTKDGDVIGLFLKRFVTSGLPAERAMQLIKAQGGVVYVPHPYGRKGLKEPLINDLKNDMDVIEIHNSWLFRHIAKPFTSNDLNKKAEEWAHENEMLMAASSDSHYSTDIGSSYTLMEDFSDQKEFLENLKGAEFVRNKARINLLSIRTWLKGKLNRDVFSFIK